MNQSASAIRERLGAIRCNQIDRGTNVDSDEDQQVQVRSGSSEIGGSDVDLGGSEAPQQSGQHLRHYYIDVPNREDNNVDSNDQHISNEHRSTISGRARFTSGGEY